VKTFHCDHCQQLVFFENVQCVKCGHLLAYVAEVDDVLSLESPGENVWHSNAKDGSQQYKLCQNYCQQSVCNWALAADSQGEFCESCRLTKVIPDLSVAGHKEKWFLLEAAKRRLLYSLLRLNLPIASKADDPNSGLAFEFLADDTAPGAKRVLTGHNNGLITINLAEADDAEREKRRLAMHEPYRTLLGHFRHEIGHYYWDRMIRGTEWTNRFRELFGNEEADYSKALQAYYKTGAPADWQERFVSAYASSHPWEDWAETWTHYLHMSDVLETAAASGLWLRPQRPDEPALAPVARKRSGRPEKFETMIENWFPLTYVLNNLNRGMGLHDAYPFVISPPAIEKLRFIHERICSLATNQ